MTTAYDRRPAAQVQRLIPTTQDPAAEAGCVLIYSRLVDGVLRVVARYANGNVSIIL